MDNESVAQKMEKWVEALTSTKIADIKSDPIMREMQVDLNALLILSAQAIIESGGDKTEQTYFIDMANAVTKLMQ